MTENQAHLDLTDANRQENIDSYKFEPIKGYPLLNWRGKRPFTSTHYYPAQLKEIHGEEVNGWRNKIYWGDNLQVMSHLLKEFRGKVNLVYIDPPFDSKADYKKKVYVEGRGIENDHSSFEDKQYTDIWVNDEYLQFMYERLVLIRELLTDNGSIWLHCDWRKSAQLRLIMDEIFGESKFRAHIVWRSMTPSGFKGKYSLGKSHDDILYYTRNKDNFTYNPVIIPYSDEYLRERFKKIDENGRKFKDEKIGTATSDETIKKLEEEGKIYITSKGTKRIKHFLSDAKGYPADDVWTDISGENSQSKAQTGYPTQKPEELVERIIAISSNPGDIIFDCFMGSGTTQAVALKLDRRFIGADINFGSIQTTTKRLINIYSNLFDSNDTQERLTFDESIQSKKGNGISGFDVYYVNNYDFFRNEIEAKELLIDALGINEMPRGSIFEGEKDGRMIKIMPINRISTKADLNELISSFDYKVFEKRQASNPNMAVERLTLICMGHEPDLAATLEKEVLPYKIDVEVVDILRDKQDLQFKRDSEADIKIDKDNLIIDQFYPMNLLQKLSLQKEKVKDWRELVESVMIDWNYDGAVLQPTAVDIPEKNTLVKGKYRIPEDAGAIRVKITDLLSESLEMDVTNA